MEPEGIISSGYFSKLFMVSVPEKRVTSSVFKNMFVLFRLLGKKDFPKTSRISLLEPVMTLRTLPQGGLPWDLFHPILY